MKGKYSLSILLVVVLLLALNPENISMAQEDPAGTIGIEGTREFDPPLLSYQGRLLENGNPVTGNRTMTFRFFYSDSGGTAIWTETKSVMVTKGMFQTNLGDTTPFSFATIIKMDQDLWLEVTVGGTTMPRQLMTGSPYAFSLVPGAHIHGDTEFLLQAVNESTGSGLFGSSRFGTGVFGESFGEGSNSFGVHGVSELGAGVAGWSSFGTGVLGESIAEGSIGFGVHGKSDGGTGVAGWSETGFGVVGWSDQGSGVWGRSTDCSGVIGESTTGTGVHAISETSYAVHGESVAGIGVFGTSTTNTGVHGISETGSAVSGVSDAGTGVEGWSTTGHGVMGMTTDGRGVIGYSVNGTGVFAGSDAGGLDPWPALQVHAFAADGVGVVSMTESTNTNMVLEQMGTGPFLKGYASDDENHKFIIENDGSFKQALEANGLVKVGLLFECDQADDYGDGGVTLIRSFNNIGGEINLSANKDNPGICTIDFGFDISGRYWIAQDPGTDILDPMLVNCSLISDTELLCHRYSLYGMVDGSFTVTSGNIMLILY